MALRVSKTLTLNSPGLVLCRSVFAATRPEGPAPRGVRFWVSDRGGELTDDADCFHHGSGTISAYNVHTGPGVTP